MNRGSPLYRSTRGSYLVAAVLPTIRRILTWTGFSDTRVVLRRKKKTIGSAAQDLAGFVSWRHAGRESPTVSISLAEPGEIETDAAGFHASLHTSFHNTGAQAEKKLRLR